MKILVTCPPMLRQFDTFRSEMERRGFLPTTPEVTQILPETELIRLVPQFDGWIIGDDPATARVFETGKGGRLKAAVKWGVGVDNVDVESCRKLGIGFSNTPGMFGREVADMALGYVVALARETFKVHDGVAHGQWPKPAGISLAGRTAAVVGFGDIGKHTVKRLLAAEMRVIVYDPFYKDVPGLDVSVSAWPSNLEQADFVIFACALTSANRHMLNAETIARLKDGVRVINVSRGPLIDEVALVSALENGKIHSAALEVFEVEPLPEDSRLRRLPQCLFGSHNSSNTVDAVVRTSERAMQLMSELLDRARVIATSEPTSDLRTQL